MRGTKGPVFVFDSIRQRSFLFFRYLSTNPQFSPISHPFLEAGLLGPQLLEHEMPNSEAVRKWASERREASGSQEDNAHSSKVFGEAVASAEAKGGIPLSNEHWFWLLRLEVVKQIWDGSISEPSQIPPNPTYLSNDIFATLRPIFLVRHPALAINSIYRDALQFTAWTKGDSGLELLMSNRGQRLLYDYFKLQGREPIVVDAEDILWRTKSLTENLCANLGPEYDVDPTLFHESWKQVDREVVETMNPFVIATTRNFLDSTGIERPSARAKPSVDRMTVSWKETYGQEVADYLERLADENMVHYEYLTQFKV